MNDVIVKRPTIENMEELHEFFEVMIIDTFDKEGLALLVDDISEEILMKKTYLQYDFDTNGEQRYFLIAVIDEKIIGTIEYGPVNELIKNGTNGEYKDLMEVGTVFVHPDYQRKGIGNLLLNSIIEVMKSKGIKAFCLDSGYQNAQRIWEHKFGEPNYLLVDYWDESNHHMIWKVLI